MRVSRIYTPSKLTLGDTISLSNTAHHHIHTVLRHRQYDKLYLFNGSGREYLGEITHMNKSTVQVRLEKELFPATESPVAIRLGQALLRPEKMEFILQKSTELGVSEINLLNTEHVSVAKSAPNLDRRMNRWESIIISASEQSGRVHLPQITPPAPLVDWLNTVSDEIKLVLSPYAEKNIQIPSETKSVCLAVGPEGGFHPEEINQMEQNGFTAIRLGPRILRAETAPLAAISLIQYFCGDLNH